MKNARLITAFFISYFLPGDGDGDARRAVAQQACNEVLAKLGDLFAMHDVLETIQRSENAITFYLAPQKGRAREPQPGVWPYCSQTNKLQHLSMPY